MYQKKERYKVMADFEKLVKDIMKECEEDEEPVTREEAEEMAKMEMKTKEHKEYTKTGKPKQKRKPRERKVDNEKLEIIKVVAATSANFRCNVSSQFVSPSDMA